MLGIIAYGSLINPRETEKQRERPTHVVPIKLVTFERSFNQLPTWRKKSGECSAVLNVQISEQNWLNAVCYCYPNFDFTDLDNRERGYTRTKVSLEKIKSYHGFNLPELTEIFIYLGKNEKKNNRILPNPEYLDICLLGAKKWGESFYHDFLNTTHINNGVLLENYLSPN